MNTDLMFSKKSVHWATPKEFYKKLDKEFHFDFDPCPLQAEQEDAMFKDWKGRVFINPPYNNIRNFLEKGLLELKKGNAKLLVYLVPVRTDTRWFHDLVYNKAELRFIKGRLRFNDGDPSARAPFPSMIIIFT